jgi:hypothetical protein
MLFVLASLAISVVAMAVQSTTANDAMVLLAAAYYLAQNKALQLVWEWS